MEFIQKCCALAVLLAISLISESDSAPILFNYLVSPPLAPRRGTTRRPFSITQPTMRGLRRREPAPIYEDTGEPKLNMSQILAQVFGTPPTKGSPTPPSNFDASTTPSPGQPQQFPRPASQQPQRPPQARPPAPQPLVPPLEQPSRPAASGGRPSFGVSTMGSQLPRQPPPRPTKPPSRPSGGDRPVWSLHDDIPSFPLGGFPGISPGSFSQGQW